MGEKLEAGVWKPISGVGRRPRSAAGAQNGGLSRIVETFSILAAIAAGAQAAALIALHLLPTGYNPEVDAVSD